MVPYPKELRIRVVAAVEEGHFSLPAIARIFQVGVRVIKKMLELHRAGEPLGPRHGGGPVPRLREQEGALLRQEMSARAAATLEELQQALADEGQVTVSLATLSRSLQFLDLPRKKSLVASERDEEARKEFRILTRALDPGQYIFIDERGSNLGLTRRYGRAAPGQRVHDQVPGDRGSNVSTIGALGREGIRTGVSVPGAIEGDTRVFFVEGRLPCPP
jgi:transposase